MERFGAARQSLRGGARSRMGSMVIEDPSAVEHARPERINTERAARARRVPGQGIQAAHEGYEGVVK